MPLNPAIAIVGMACVYPEARTPGELWDNVLAQRRAFRHLPAERLRREDYLSDDKSAPDRTYAAEAAVIEGYEFDRVKFKVVGSTYRSADLAHWLALDVSSRALDDAGFENGNGLPKETTGVVLGNTLTGEFSRANTMRLRWPYVQRLLNSALAEKDWSTEQRAEFLAQLEERYKDPFPSVGEESLAGGLSNTIAGRICNQFDLKGGGFTVDGACASSLLAVSNAASSLTIGDVDVALAGGVDLSLDPFEIVGFAKTGALAPELMRIYDQRSAGFWPGEGCGFVVLMRHEDAIAQCRKIYAVIRGWGISSDGSGGITRPEVDGQLKALHRAYKRAGYGVESVGYFEGHGTGTLVGDETELRVLSRARREAQANAMPAAIGSVKANIGHTKAAAGIAGLIKATLAVHEQLLPPTTGCERPHSELQGEAPALRILRQPEIWPPGVPVRASVSSMGFGGINAHITLESATEDRRSRLNSRECSLATSAQDSELFLLSGSDESTLLTQVEQVLAFASQLSRSELPDLAAELARQLKPQGIRAAVVASTPDELDHRLQILKSWLAEGVSECLDFQKGIFLSANNKAPRLGFLFPGQGSPANLGGGIFSRRFESVQEMYAEADLPQKGDGVSTDVAQPAIATASLSGINVLRSFGLEATAGIGHSLGEIIALHWAGVYDQAALLRIARERGRAMAELGSPTGTMAAIASSAAEVNALLNGEPVSIVGYNSPRQTVIAGDKEAVNSVSHRATQKGLRSTPLAVSHAFHTPLVSEAIPRLAEALAKEEFRAPQHSVISTVTGQAIEAGDDLREVLCRQVTSPVRFIDAVSVAEKDVDLWIEVGPGRTLSSLAADCQSKPVIAIDASGDSLQGLWKAVGAVFALGAPVQTLALFHGRFTRPFNIDWQPSFFMNPCELAPVADELGATMDRVKQLRSQALVEASSAVAVDQPTGSADISPLELVRELVAERAELPVTAVSDDSQLLSDLHLNSITVGQLIGDAARRLEIPPIIGINEFANASVAQVAEALEQLQRDGTVESVTEHKLPPPGVDAWVRPFTVEWIAKERIKAVAASTTKQAGNWKVFAPPDHPMTKKLHQRLAASGGSGVVVCLPPEPDLARLRKESACLVDEGGQISLLLQGAKAVLAQKENPRFVLVQHGWNAGGFARTLRLEAPFVTTCVVEVPIDHEKSVDWISEEALGAEDYVEARYDAEGQRWEPRLQALALSEETKLLPLGSNDVLLVTGGGKGITAECAYVLARDSGASLAILGRSKPNADEELSANLERLTAAGVRFEYYPADVNNASGVKEAAQAAEHDLGKVTAILHGAGANIPKAISTLEENDFGRTLSPKIQGFRNLLAAVPPEQLKLCISFGSIIARAGLHGEADYAVANEWQTLLTERLQQVNPQCRCLAIEWSVWSGLGMGQRLGRVESLIQHGITPIPPDQGVAILKQLLGQNTPAVVVVTGRYGDSPILKMEQPDLPFTRFIEQSRVFYPGVELIVDAVLSPENDPYVEDHIYHGERLFPAVMGLEAMAQVAMALAGRSDLPQFENVEFHRPVVVPKDGKMTIRLAALMQGNHDVEVALRCEESGFQVDHFRAVCRFGKNANELLKADVQDLNHALIPLDVEQDLYRDLMFHTGRFQRLLGYQVLKAKECLAEIHVDSQTPWFNQYLPPNLVLGDPGMRDAAIHGIQSCIPHARLLPVGVDQIIAGKVPSADTDKVYLHAQELKQDGDTFHYDLCILTSNGQVLERWKGLRLRRIAAIEHRGPWAEPLFNVYLERRINEFMPSANLTVSLQQDEMQDRNGRSQRTLTKALGKSAKLHHRADGKPELMEEPGRAGELSCRKVSIAHQDQYTLTALGKGTIGCDLERVDHRTEESWMDLLGEDRMQLAHLIEREHGEDADTAATRIWTARECLKKAGSTTDAPLVIQEASEDGWIAFMSGSLKIATHVGMLGNQQYKVVSAVLAEGRPASSQLNDQNSKEAPNQKLQTEAT